MHLCLKLIDYCIFDPVTLDVVSLLFSHKSEPHEGTCEGDLYLPLPLSLHSLEERVF